MHETASFSESTFLFEGFSFASGDLFFLVASTSIYTSLVVVSCLSFEPCLGDVCSDPPPATGRAVTVVAIIVVIVGLCVGGGHAVCLLEALLLAM